MVMKLFFKKALAISTLATLTSTLSYAETVTAHIAEWRPYVYKEDSNYGPISDYISQIFNEMNVTLETKYTNWSRAYQKVKEGTDHVTYPWADRENRRKDMLFSAMPILESRLYVYYNPEFLDGAKIDSHEGLSGVKVSYPRDFSEEKLLKKAKAKLNTVNDYESVIKMIQTGRAHATIGEPTVVSTIIQKLNVPNGIIVRSEKPVTTNKYYAIFSRNTENAEELVKRFNEAHKKVGEYQ